MSISILFILISYPTVNSILIFLDEPKSPETYGPYVVNWKYYGPCPLSRDNIGKVSLDITNEKNVSKGLLTLTLPDDIRFDELKIVVFTIKNNRKSIIWNYKINKPCQHDLFAAMWKGTGSRNCVLKKGEHNCSINFTEMIQKFYGPTFFYGEYVFKINVTNKKQSVICLTFHEELVKKK